MLPCPEHPQLDSESVLGDTRILARNRDQNPATCSQERNEDTPRQAGLLETDLLCVNVYSESVLCLGKMHDHSEASGNGKVKSQKFQQSNEYAEFVLELMEKQLSSSGIFSQDSHRLRFSERSRKIWKFDKIHPEQFGGRILFMSMFNDIDRI